MQRFATMARTRLDADDAEPPASAEPRPINWLTFVLVALAGCLVTIALRPLNFVHHDTTEAVMWSQTPWSLGFWKHPPLLPWVLKIWFGVMPMHPLSLAALTGVNLAVGAWAVWRIARLSLDQRSAALALALLGVLPYATVMGIKLNHNAILISLWPLAILAFLRALDRPGWQRGLVLGIAGAAGMLAKYYTGLLLAAMLLAAIASPQRWRFFSRPAPYVAAVTFFVLMAPHALWMLDHK
jgi:4-amino-4-deoxy-L-arabinose transferase-like glycosyltransferase